MRTKFLMATALALLSTSPASASSISGGTVTGFSTKPNTSLVFVYVAGTRLNGIPTCSNPAEPTRWAFDATTPVGQVWLSLFMTARAQNEKVTIYGYGGCELAGDAESVIQVATNNTVI